MQPDMIRQLEQLQRQAAELGQLARDLTAAAPRHTEGSDSTGWVQVVLSGDGTPAEIRVRDGWQQRLEPERLGSAVLDANTDAVQRAMKAWSAGLDDERWWQKRAESEIDTDTAFRIGEQPHLPAGEVRDLNELAEVVLAKLEVARSQPVAPPSTGQGQDDGGHVTVGLGAGGITDCIVDPEWAVRRDGSAISAALATALRRAVAQRPQPSSDAELDSLAGDALATLRAVTAEAPNQGGDR